MEILDIAPFCLTCEWYCKPFWSVNSPCKGCPHSVLKYFDKPRHEYEYTSTTTTTTNGSKLTYNFGKTTGDVHVTEEKTPEFVKDLPSAEEYQKSLEQFISNETWSEPKYLCPKCGEGGMRRREDIVLASYPPQRLYECDKCGHTEYQFG